MRMLEIIDTDPEPSPSKNAKQGLRSMRSPKQAVAQECGDHDGGVPGILDAIGYVTSAFFLFETQVVLIMLGCCALLLDAIL
jgi:hypothetical protein